MCMSPHEMTSARIGEIVAAYQQAFAETGDRWYQSRIKAFEAILKERAEDGIYATAGGVDNDHQRRLVR